MTQTSRPESGSPRPSPTATLAETSAVREIMGAAATLALAWRVPPKTVLFLLAGEAPAEAEWGRLISGSWDRLPAAQRAHLNAFASEAA